MSIESVVPPNHLFLWNPLLFFPSIFASIRVFSDELALHIRRPNYWSFSIGSSNEYSELISFRIDWFDLFAVQGTLKTILQHHSLKVSVLQCSAFFMVQLSHTYMTTGKTIALTRGTFVGKVMSLLLNMLSRLFIAFLPRSKYLLISVYKVGCEHFHFTIERGCTLESPWNELIWEGWLVWHYQNYHICDTHHPSDKHNFIPSQ